MMFLLILIYLAVIAFEIPKLVREKKWRDLVVFHCLCCWLLV